MKFELLQIKIEQIPIFTFNDILKWFPKNNPNTLKIQIHNWLKKEKIISLKKGLYYFPKVKLKDVFFIAPKLYYPSYISLETALNYYGLIPDVAQKIISVSPLATANFATSLGNFSFHKIQTKYFFGYRTVKDKQGLFFYNIALPEKALSDFLYFHSSQFQNIEDLKAQRFNIGDDFNWSKFIETSKIFKQAKLIKLALDLKKLYA